jgi:YggT family protein
MAYVTPKAVNPVVMWLFGAVWMFWLRVLLLWIFLAYAAQATG